jgi:hypothetical protein
MNDRWTAASAAPVASTECIICGQVRDRGIHICGEFICESCEREIVKTDVTDEKYRYYIECMKRIWLAAMS